MNARTGMCSGLTCLVVVGLLIAAPGAQGRGEPVELAGARYACEGGVATLSLEASEDLTFDVFSMRDPYRVVLDLVGVKAPWKVAVPEADPLVYDLRYSLWKDSPAESIVRYVLETHEEARYTVERRGQGLALRVWTEQDVPEKAPAPDPVTADSAEAQEPPEAEGPDAPAPEESAQTWGPMLVPFSAAGGPPVKTAADVGEPEPWQPETAAVREPQRKQPETAGAETPAGDVAVPDAEASAAPAEWFAELAPEPATTDPAPSETAGSGEAELDYWNLSYAGSSGDTAWDAAPASGDLAPEATEDQVWSDEDCPEMWGDELVLGPAPVDPLAAFVEGEQAEAVPEQDFSGDETWVATRDAGASWSAPAPAPGAAVAAAPDAGEVDLTDETAHYDPYQKLIARHRPGAVRRAHETWLKDRPRHAEAPDFGTGGSSGFGQAAGSQLPMSLDVQGADVHTVLRSIATYAGVNIVADANVKGALTLRALDLPWYEMLDAVCRAMGLVAMDHGSFIRVATERTAQDEALARESAARKQEDLMPLETAIVPLRYGNADELKTVVNAMRTARGSVEIDERTNSLIVTDIAPRLEELRHTLTDLDTQTLQIEITAELVDVDATMSRQLGIAWGFSNLHSTDANASGSVTMSADDVVGTAGDVQVGVLRSFGELQARIQALATDNKADIISTPRITTVNNRMARILVGKEVPVITMDEAGNAITEYKQVGITLEVTPHVNSDEEITLDIHPEISDLSQEATVQGGVVFNTTEADTRVMVSNGETAVIGGLLNTRKTKFERGVPVLKDLPVLGYLFRSTDEQDDKRELLIFVTPRIVVAGGK